MARRNRDDGGVALVQYALLIALIAGVALAAVRQVGLAGEETFQATADGLGGSSSAPAAPPHVPDPPPPVTVGPPNTGNPPPPATTPTTAPSTTTPPATTPPSTAPPTTTPTTAPPPAGPSTTDWEDLSVSGNSGRWGASATLTLRSADAKPLPGATVTVTVRAYTRSGFGYSWEEEQVTLTTGDDGRATLDQDFKGSNGNGQVLAVQYRVNGVESPGGPAWDGDDSTITFYRP